MTSLMYILAYTQQFIAKKKEIKIYHSEAIARENCEFMSHNKFQSFFTDCPFLSCTHCVYSFQHSFPLFPLTAVRIVNLCQKKKRKLFFIIKNFSVLIQQQQRRLIYVNVCECVCIFVCSNAKREACFSLSLSLFFLFFLFLHP